jgi:tetratricopeptide (TPR) repeat protein
MEPRKAIPGQAALLALLLGACRSSRPEPLPGPGVLPPLTVARTVEDARADVVDALDADRMHDALAAVERVLALTPDDPYAHAMHAQVLSFLERPEAAEAWAEAVTRAPERGDWRCEHTWELFVAARYAEAAETYERLWASNYHAGDPSSSGWVWRGLWYEGPDDEPPPDDGFDGWTEVFGAWDVHEWGGWSHLYLGNLAAALRAFERQCELFPDDYTGHEGAGLVLHLLDRPDEAAAAFARAKELEPDVADLRSDIGLEHLEAGRWNEALLCLDLALALDPENPHAHTNRGWALSRLGRVEEALAEHERAVELRADLPEVHYNRGLELAALGRHAEAVQAYDRALALGAGAEHDADAHYCRGNALLKMGDREGAVAAYGRALELVPDFPQALYNRSHVLHELGRFEEALREVEHYLRLEPDDLDGLTKRGECLEQLGRTAEALQAFERALVLAPRSARLREAVQRLR